QAPALENIFTGYPAIANKGQKQQSALGIEACLSQAGGLRLRAARNPASELERRYEAQKSVSPSRHGGMRRLGACLMRWNDSDTVWAVVQLL
ncbi:MAG: hypothetical protein Q9180_003029, partial [Flavoplaca navasiana]